jgi:hypothetical protein
METAQSSEGNSEPSNKEKKRNELAEIIRAKIEGKDVVELEKAYGKRSATKINLLTEMVHSKMEGKSSKELFDKYRYDYSKNMKTVDSLICNIKVLGFSEKERKLEVLWVYGEAGTGRSYKAFGENKSVYKKSDGKWWDGYEGEDVVIFNCINNIREKEYELWLEWLDKRTLKARVKHGYVSLCFIRAIITSDKTPRQVWDSKKFLEKITKIFEFKEDHSLEDVTIREKQQDPYKGLTRRTLKL